MALAGAASSVHQRASMRVCNVRSDPSGGIAQLGQYIAAVRQQRVSRVLPGDLPFQIGRAGGIAGQCQGDGVTGMTGRGRRGIAGLRQPIAPDLDHGLVRQGRVNRDQPVHGLRLGELRVVPGNLPQPRMPGWPGWPRGNKRRVAGP